MVTTTPIVVCVVGVMCALAPPTEGFTMPGCFAPSVTGAGDSFYSVERRLAAACSSATSGGAGAGTATALSATGVGSGPPERGTAAKGSRSAVLTASTMRRRIGAEGERETPGRRNINIPSRAHHISTSIGSSISSTGRMSAVAPGPPARSATVAPSADIATSSKRSHEAQQRREIRESRARYEGEQREQHERDDASLSQWERIQQQQQRRREEAERAEVAKANSGHRKASMSRAARSATSVGRRRMRKASSSTVVDPLTLYLDSLRHVNLLTAAEEQDLGGKIQKGMRSERARSVLTTLQGAPPTDEQVAEALQISLEQLAQDLKEAHFAKQAMVTANLRLVVNISKRFSFLDVPTTDLIQEGTLGLVKATEKFNPERGFRFSTYATWWIKQSIMIGIGNQARTIRLPIHVHGFLNSIRKATRELTVDGRPPTDEELGKEIGASVEKIKFYRNAARVTNSVSLDAGVKNPTDGGSRDSTELGVTLGDGPSPEDLSQETDMRDKISALLDTLDYREERVVRARYGLNGIDAKTLEEIGGEFGITRERVRQIEMGALAKLRQPYRNYRLRDFALGKIFKKTGVLTPTPEVMATAADNVAMAEERNEKQLQTYADARIGVGLERGSTLSPEQRALEIESKRKSLDKAWNDQSTASLDGMFERDFQEPHISASPASAVPEREACLDAVQQESLSMVS